MKSQDIVLLLKLVSLEQQANVADSPVAPEVFSMRALEEATGISKSEVSSAMQRCFAVGLAKSERKTGLPRTNSKALYEFIAYGLKYVFPAKPGAITRGIATGHAAPIMAGKLLSAGQHVYVWPDAQGNVTGQGVEPLFRTVTKAVKQDENLYAMLALVDAIRLGNEREAALAKKMLQQMLRGEPP